jgi:hypothetical protein
VRCDDRPIDAGCRDEMIGKEMRHYYFDKD